MRVRQIAWMLVGSLVAFVGCAVQQSGGPIAAGDSGPADVLAEAAVDALSDTLGVDISPARDAEAGPTDPTTTTVVKCVAVGPGAYTAQASFPGRTKEDLSRSSAMHCSGAEWCWTTGFAVKAGAVQANCINDAETVTFVVPPAI